MRSNDFLCFYDWESGKFIKQIDVRSYFLHRAVLFIFQVNARQLYWSENGSRLVIGVLMPIILPPSHLSASDTAFYELAYNADVVANALATNSFTVDGDVDGAFPGEEIEVAEKVLFLFRCRSLCFFLFFFFFVNSRFVLALGLEIASYTSIQRTN